MANEPTITITGNLTADPELRYTTTSQPVASFTIANTPRYRDQATGEWKDGETWFVRCSAWRDLAENAAASLTRGAAVVATGRLRSRSYEATDKTTGQQVKRTVVEMTVDDLGPSLRRATARVIKTTREHPHNTNNGNGAGAVPVQDLWTTHTTPAPAPTSAPAPGSVGEGSAPAAPQSTVPAPAGEQAHSGGFPDQFSHRFSDEPPF